MRNLCLVICFIGVWTTSSAHPSPDPWAHLTISERVDTLKSVILKLDKNNLDSILTLSKRLRRLADKIQDDKAVAFSVEQMAWAYKHKKALDHSIRYYFQLEKFYHRLNDDGGIGTAYFNIGQIFAEAYQFDRSLSYLKLAIEHYEKADEPYNISKAWYEMGKRYIEKNNPQTAEKFLNKALKLCQQIKDTSSSTSLVSHASMIYNRLGWAAKDQEDYLGARHYYHKSVSVLDVPGDWNRKKAIAKNNIGETYLLERKYDSATYYFKEAMALKNKLNCPESSLETMIQLANLAHQHGKTDEALKWLDQGIAKMDPKVPNEKLTKALELVTSIANDTTNNTNLFSDQDFGKYLRLQQQQLIAMKDLKNELDKASDKYHVLAGLSQNKYEQKHEILNASMNRRTYWLGGISAFLFVLAAIGLGYAKKEKREKQNVLQDKDAFVTEQVKNYDQRILQMLIVKAEYEEMKTRLKKDYGLDDEDFTG